MVFTVFFFNPKIVRFTYKYACTPVVRRILRAEKTVVKYKHTIALRASSAWGEKCDRW